MQAEQLRDWRGEALIAAHHHELMPASAMYANNECDLQQHSLSDAFVTPNGCPPSTAAA